MPPAKPEARKFSAQQRRAIVAFLLDVFFRSQFRPLATFAGVTDARNSKALDASTRAYLRAEYQRGMTERQRLSLLEDPALLAELRAGVSRALRYGAEHTALVAECEAMDRYISAGRRSIEGGRKASHKVHGTPAERATKYAPFQMAVDESRAAHPQWSRTQVCESVAKKFGRSSKTIMRRTAWDKT
jgi:hypothetical protein